ncbi:MAG: DNA polymerase III subunit delta' [Hyphomicrobiales bacterium]
MKSAEDNPDPREIARHPRRRGTLHGHGAAEARLLRALRSGKLHHAWLLTGPRGIGKATLAYRFARYLLQFPEANGRASLQVAPEVSTARQIAAGAHPDLLVVERAYDAKNKRVKSEIAVDDARLAGNFFALTAGAGGWRIAIVDTADDLNNESSNALLKILEEPPSRSVFLLVSHRPGTLLRTIRSRCIRLDLAPLNLDDTMRVLHEVSETADEEQLRRAAELSGGSPGRALELLDSRGAQAFAAFLAKPKLTPAARIEIANYFAGRDAGADFEIFCELLIAWTAARAREAGLAGGGRALARAHDGIAHSIREANAVNLDRRQTAVEALTLLDEALRAA